ncbi:hypothetical protein EJB05_14669, partial [Eragrostis curvula]
MAKSAGEHRVQILQARDAGRQGKGGTKPEKQLNCFVRALTLIERLGNALGTLAFTWATVILLGGYPTVLRRENDFWFATIIVFLEAARMFSRNNRMDYQLFFHTKSAVRPLGWNGLIVIVYLSNIQSYLFMLAKFIQLPMTFRTLTLLLILVVPSILGIFQSSGALELLSKRLRDAISLFSPLFATILLVPLIAKLTTRDTRAKWIVLFTLLFLAVLLLTINKFRFQRNRKLPSEHARIKQRTFKHRLILNLCMFAELVMLVAMPGHPHIRTVMFTYEACALVLLSFGNLQIPAAMIRIVLSLLRLIPQDYHGKDTDNPAKKNLTPSLNIFYAMVLGQGILYCVACLLGTFSFIPRRSLARRGGFKGQKGVEFVNLYYAYAWDKCMENDALVRKKISLSSFAIDSINSDSPTRQLHGVQLMHSLLQMEPSRTRLISKLNASMVTMDRLFRMLDWTSPEDATIRLFAAKVIAELAKSLRVVTVPGMIQLVSALLDTHRKPKRESALLDTDDDEQEGDQVTSAINIQGGNYDFIMGAHDNRRQRQDHSTQDETQACSNKQIGMDDQTFWFLRCWKWISSLWSDPHEEPPMDHDNLPALGMSILDSLASYDYDNCMEISRAADLISKIIEFTYYNYIENINEVQKKILMGSSLKLLRRFSNISGEIGITLRHKISEHPVLLRNLAGILDDIVGSLELRKLAVEIIRNLAIDGNTSHEIGRIKMIVTRLVDAFLSQGAPSSTNSNHFLQKVAGQALAMLTMESADNCAAILAEPRDFIKELTTMISGNKHPYVAAKLLHNLFLHIRIELSNPELRKLCEALGKVLETILNPNSSEAELEVFIGLSSQICRIIPEDFARELEKNGHGKEIFVNRLVDVLKANMNPAIHSPGIRRVIIEQAIYLMKDSSYSYAIQFKQHGMMETLLMVEQTPSRVERYRIFMGNAGYMEHKEPITDLVTVAKELMTM